MKGLLELSLIVGLIVIPMRFVRGPAATFWPVVILCVGYFVMALFILPRLPG